MSTSAATIIAHLKVVESERARRVESAGLEAKVVALKWYQQRRFSHAYGDLLQSLRYGPASRFFLEELYGPNDFTRRDAQFARVVPALVRLFPDEIVDTVSTLAELHALSETLDTAMAVQLDGSALDGIAYIRAWKATGSAPAREKQISLTLDVAGRLERFTGRLLLRNSLRMMRGPARAAGMGELQRFLETGFDTFRAMKGAQDFIAIVATRERALASILFSANLSDLKGASIKQALAILPGIAVVE